MLEASGACSFVLLASRFLGSCARCHWRFLGVGFSGVGVGMPTASTATITTTNTATESKLGTSARPHLTKSDLISTRRSLAAALTALGLAQLFLAELIVAFDFDSEHVVDAFISQPAMGRSSPRSPISGAT